MLYQVAFLLQINNFNIVDAFKFMEIVSRDAGIPYEIILAWFFSAAVLYPFSHKSQSDLSKSRFCNDFALF